MDPIKPKRPKKNKVPMQSTPATRSEVNALVNASNTIRKANALKTTDSIRAAINTKGMRKRRAKKDN